MSDSGHYFIKLIVVFFIVAGFVQSLQAASSDILAQIGDVTITVDDLQKKLDDLPPYARKNFETPEGKKKLLRRLVQTELLLKAAEDAGYEHRPDIQEKLKDARKRILTSEYFKNEIGQKPLIDESKLKTYYEKHKENYAIPASVEARHILVNTKNEALQLRERILKNELTFSEAIKQYSTDTETKNNGGRLGTIRKGGFIKGIGHSASFEDALFSTKVNEITPPLKSRRGWHLVQVTNRHEAGYQPFEKVKAGIADEMLVSEADIQREYNDHPDKYMTRPRCSIKHIQLKTESEAQDVYKQLKQGADFSELVRTRSTDTASVRHDGNLGYLYKDGYIRGIGKDPDFEKAVFALKKGEFSKPIKTKKGWHIVLVEDKVDAHQKPLSEVHDIIKKKLIRDAKERRMNKRFDDLEKKYHCTIYFDRLDSSK